MLDALQQYLHGRRARETRSQHRVESVGVDAKHLGHLNHQRHVHDRNARPRTMNIRPCLPADHAEWQRMRSALWPDQTGADMDSWQPRPDAVTLVAGAGPG